MKKINVAISIAIGDDTSIWNSGLNQNLAFMVLLLRRMSMVDKVFLVAVGGPAQLPKSLGFEELGAPLVRPDDVTYQVDLVIEMGVSLPLEWLRHVRALGCRIVTLLVGHSYPAQAEVPIFDRGGGPAFIGTPWHELWTLPQHMKTSAPLLRTVGRVPVHEVPHIWSPMFLERQIRAVEQSGHIFGFMPRPGKAWRVAIFEPNISVVKACFIPMLVCDAAYRKERAAVGLMMVMNTFHMKEHVTFNRFALHLDLTRDGKASYEPRLAFAECMAVQKMDAVVAHHWECGLNYAYYDALYGGYPLVHNSEFLRAAGMGFFYPGFAAIQGGEALLDGWRREQGYWEGYRREARAYLRKLLPDDEANVRAYTDRIASLLGGPA